MNWQTFRTRCDPMIEDEVHRALVDLFGATSLRIEQVPWEVAWSGKSIQYTRDAEGAP